ncbi:hypothetical protein GWK47_000004 [Chionoecetes opilio]|uniref:Uncharacterized protein n=1 Tax=Chionoecetes opilio TaxID=41210 RepID=A0A8J5CX68_CHIOP|nr:hypothetical protein GWK47_000004 [Chionoecetes opilio]
MGSLPHWFQGEHFGPQGGREAHSPPSPIDMPQTRLIHLTFRYINRHWDNELTDAFQYTSLGYTHEPNHWWAHSPSLPWTPRHQTPGLGPQNPPTPTYTNGHETGPHAPGAPHTRAHLNPPPQFLVTTPIARHSSNHYPPSPPRPTCDLRWLSRPGFGIQKIFKQTPDLPTQTGKCKGSNP